MKRNEKSAVCKILCFRDLTNIQKSTHNASKKNTKLVIFKKNIPDPLAKFCSFMVFTIKIDYELLNWFSTMNYTYRRFACDITSLVFSHQN